MIRGLIEHPERLGYSARRIEETFDLYLQGRIPPPIQRWLLTVPLKHALRAIYGSDLRAALALLRQALALRAAE